MKSILFILTFILSINAFADNKLQEKINDAFNFAELATANTIFHELGHFVIRNYDVQKFTFEEDLADSYVVYNLLKKPSQYKSKEIYEKYSKDHHKVLMAGADIFYYRTLLGIDNKVTAYSHSTDERRFYNYVCLMKDGNPNFFNDYISKRQLELFLKNKCRSRYNNLVKSWKFFLNDKWGSNKKDYYKVIYKKSEVRKHKIIKEYLSRDNNWINWSMKEFRTKTSNKLTVSFENCNGIKNAYYIDKSKTIKICYEYFQSLVDLRMKILKLKESL